MGGKKNTLWFKGKRCKGFHNFCLQNKNLKSHRGVIRLVKSQLLNLILFFFFCFFDEGLRDLLEEITEETHESAQADRAERKKIVEKMFKSVSGNKIVTSSNLTKH